jgi:hypothetical protein
MDAAATQGDQSFGESLETLLRIKLSFESP